MAEAVIRRHRLRWYGKGRHDWVKGCTKLLVEGTAPNSRSESDGYQPRGSAGPCQLEEGSWGKGKCSRA